MSDHGLVTITELTREMKTALDSIQREDAVRVRMIETKADKAEVERIAKDMATKMAALQSATDRLSARMGRPAAGGIDANATSLREQARGLLETKFFNAVTRANSDIVFNPSEDEITEAEVACKAIKRLFKVSHGQLTAPETKALTSFAVGSSTFLLPPELASAVVSCIISPTDVTALMAQMQISGPSVKFLVDNVVVNDSAWACDTQCFANNPGPELANGLGEIEIAVHPLRHVVCVNASLLEDSAISVEDWVMRKVSEGFAAKVSESVMLGDGIGKPLGLLHKSAGIQACATAPGTPLGQFTWQDLIALKMLVNEKYWAKGVYCMSQETFGLLLTQSNALGDPVMIARPTDPSVFLINGSPVKLNSWMPPVAPGSCPILYGDLQSTYQIVWRKAISMVHDIYSAAFCHLFRFESRVGGSILCPNASRLLLIK
jgi:HK97 family phage major capsid protein